MMLCSVWAVARAEAALWQSLPDVPAAAGAGPAGEPAAVRSLFDQLWQQHGNPYAPAPQQRGALERLWSFYCSIRVPVCCECMYLGMVPWMR